MSISRCYLGAVFLGLFFFSTSNSLAQADILLVGKLLDANSGQPIANVSVKPLDYPESTYAFSDALGEFYLYLDSLPTQVLFSNLQYNALVNYSPPIEGVWTIYLEAKNHHLAEAEVTVYQIESKQLATPTEVSVITARDLQRSDGSDLQWALNQVPGVIMETRGYGGSRRLNIRGTTVRSPFAVRNIKMYLDEFPLTNPDGSSPLELLDAEDIASIVVIKGPAGSAYGSINGGTLLFSPRGVSTQKLKLRSSLQLGSFGYLKASQAASISSKKAKVRVSRIDQSFEGYRDQESNHKEQTTLSLDLKASNRLQYFIWATDYKGDWDLPGAINAADAAEDPTQARVYAIENNTRVERNRQYVGVRQRWTTRHFTNNTAFYFTQTKKVNPYGTSPFFNGYKNEAGEGFGGRTRFTGDIKKWSNSSLSGTVGAEFQIDDNQLNEFELLDGLPRDVKFSNSTNSAQATAFAGLKYEQKTNLVIEAGIGWTETIYTNTGINYSLTGDSANLRARLPYRALLPRLGISKRLFNETYAFVNLNTGTSAPSVFEVVNPYDGRFSPDLLAENAQNAEVGLKGYSLNFRFQGGLTVYSMTLSNPILENAESEGPLYFNLSELRLQRGVEAWLQHNFPFNSDGFMQQLVVQGNATFNDYKYASDSLQVPGTPFATAQIQLILEMTHGLSLVLADRWSDGMFLNSAGTVTSPSYHLGQAEIRYKQKFVDDKMELEMQFGARNLWNSSYSSFFQLDGVFGRYYNPAPPRSFFGGLALSYSF